MKFPDCTVVSINLPNELLEVIDTRATKRILNRSACVRELVTEALRDTERPKAIHADIANLSGNMNISKAAVIRKSIEDYVHKLQAHEALEYLQNMDVLESRDSQDLEYPSGR